MLIHVLMLGRCISDDIPAHDYVDVSGDDFRISYTVLSIIAIIWNYINAHTSKEHAVNTLVSLNIHHLATMMMRHSTHQSYHTSDAHATA